MPARFKHCVAALLLASPLTTLAQRPGDLKPLDRPHPGFALEQARPEAFKPSVGALCFLPDGRLAVAAFPPKNNGVFREEYNGILYIIDNPTETDTAKIKVTEVTGDLHDPLGASYVDGALYIVDRNEVSKWSDTDEDGLPDKRETFASGWISDNYHHFSFGLPYDGENFYVTLSTNISFRRMIQDENIKGKVVAMNGPNPEFRGSLLKINGKTGEYEVVSGGLRTPNGVSMGPDGVVLIPDNQGAWKPASGIYVGQQGAFFGYYSNTEATSDFYPDGGVPAAFSDQPVTHPAVWLPQSECANSPGELVEIPEGLQHAGQYLMAEVTRGGIRRVFLEKVGGTWQGAVFRHSQGFEAGLNRLAWGPDGCLYAGGMGAGKGNWGWKNKTFGLQRLRPTGEHAFEYDKIQATKDGFRIRFTKPVQQGVLEDPASYEIHAWTYKPTAKYGGPKVPGKKEQQAVTVAKAAPAADGMSVEITLDRPRRPNHVYHFRTDIASKAGEKMWTTEAWVTFHNAPTD